MSLSNSTYHSNKTIANFSFFAEKTITKNTATKFLYEKDNHLGNVLAVISDRKIARDTDQDNTVDYYEPDVLLTYDYSPFGAPLHARSFTKEVCDEVTFTLVVEDLNTNFDDGTTQGWTALSSTPILSVTNDGKLEVKKQGGGAGLLGVQQSIMATNGLVYDFTIFIENGFTSNATIVLELIDPNNTVIYTQSVGNGSSNTFTHQFTASSTGTYIVKVYRTGNQASGSFYIDDALITHEEEVTQTLCEDFAGYRYGFNGMERDNESKGFGNEYTTFFRQYDPRLGRWLSIDPELAYMPWQSPYVSMDNNPIYLNDPFGNCTDCPNKISEYDKGTVRTAANLFKKNITDAGIKAKDFDFSKLDDSSKEEISVAIKTNPEVRGAFNVMVKQQTYLETHQGDNPVYANFIDDLMNNISTVGDLNAVADLRESLHGRLQGEYMMAIFSPENVGTILALWSPVDKFKKVRGKAFGSKNMSLIRAAYVKNVNGLASLGKTLLNKGVSKEMTARILHAQRRYLGKVFKDATPPDMLKKIFDRNLKKYGDKWGPNIEYLRKQGKTWDEIIESSSRTGGKDLGF